MRARWLLVTSFALAACGGHDELVGTYPGTLEGHYQAQTTAGRASGSFPFHETTSLVVTKLGDHHYRLQLGTCAFDAPVAPTALPISYDAHTCALRLAGHDAVTLTDARLVITLQAGHAQVTLDSSSTQGADGIWTSIHGEFSGDKR